MTNVVAFPGVSLDNIDMDDHNQYAFTPQEILAFVTAHLARQICEPTTPNAVVSIGISDEGDGWLYSQKEINRTGWADTTPVCRFEKDANGVRGRFFQPVIVDGEEIRLSNISARNLNELLDQRMQKAQKSVQRILQQVHAPVANEIASEIIDNFLPRVAVNRYDPDVLTNIDYDAVERMYAVFDESSARAMRRVTLVSALDG